MMTATQRPRPPLDLGYFHPYYEVPHAHLFRIVQWAVSWTGGSVEMSSADIAAVMIRSFEDGSVAEQRALDATTQEIIQVAFGFLTGYSDHQNARRQARAFPHIEFIAPDLGPAIQPCAAARAIHRNIYRNDFDYPLPLPECDAKRCHCKLRPMSDGQLRRERNISI